MAPTDWRWDGAVGTFMLYYGDPSDVTGQVPGSPLPFLGPTKLIYADGAPTGSLTLQLLYVAITDGTVVPFGAAAVLIHP